MRGSSSSPPNGSHALGRPIRLLRPPHSTTPPTFLRSPGGEALASPLRVFILRALGKVLVVRFEVGPHRLGGFDGMPGPNGVEDAGVMIVGQGRAVSADCPPPRLDQQLLDRRQHDAEQGIAGRLGQDRVKLQVGLDVGLQRSARGRPARPAPPPAGPDGRRCGAGRPRRRWPSPAAGARRPRRRGGLLPSAIESDSPRRSACRSAPRRACRNRGRCAPGPCWPVGRALRAPRSDSRPFPR